MATYRAVATTETDPQAPITSALMKALEANHRAAMEGDSTAVAAGVTLLDAALNTGAATTAGTAWVGLRIAAMNTGTVGSYALLSDQTNSGPTDVTRSPGSTLAGSSLIYSRADGAAAGSSSSPSGTWRCMGYSTYNSAANIALTSGLRATLWLRIS